MTETRASREAINAVRRTFDLPPLCASCGKPMVQYDALVDRMVPHDCEKEQARAE